MLKKQEIDSNHNLLPDWWELEKGYEAILPFNAEAHDPDQDGLSTLAEIYAGSDPKISDSDNDGLSDGQEIAAGSDPLTLTLPEIALETSWREAEGTDTRAYGTSGAYPRVVVGTATNGGEPATFPRTAPAGGAYVNVNQFLEEILGDYPWSAWEPWRGLEIARAAQYRRGNSSAGVSPPPLFSHRFTRRDVRVRLSASRPMPAGTKWTVHLRQAERWISGAEGIKWTTPVPGADPEVLTLTAGQRETVRTYIITQGSPNPGDPSDTSPSLEGRREIVLNATGTFVTPTQNDSD